MNLNEKQQGDSLSSIEVVELVEEVTELVEEVAELVEEVEIEIYGKRNERPPKAHRYVIRIDKVKYTVHVPSLIGRQLLELAGKLPPEKYSISQKLHGGQVQTIGLNDTADFTQPGVERFMTLPLDQTEGC